MTVRARTSFESFRTLTGKLDKHKRVFFTRFGDGEVVAMMGKDHRNYTTSEGLVKELRESFTIKHPQYLMALTINIPQEKKMAPGVFERFSSNDSLFRFLEQNNLLIQDEYESPVIFHYLSVFYPRMMYDFFETYVRPRKKMFVGCTPQHTAEKLYGPIDHYVRIPPRNAYNTIDEWWPEIEQHVNKVDLVVPSAGAASNVISKRLWNMGTDIHLLDIGSIVDAVEGKKSRTWIRLQGHQVEKVLPPKYRNRNFLKRLSNFRNDLKYYYRRYFK
jgi:hypothetical protein